MQSAWTLDPVGLGTSRVRSNYAPEVSRSVPSSAQRVL